MENKKPKYTHGIASAYKQDAESLYGFKSDRGLMQRLQNLDESGFGKAVQYAFWVVILGALWFAVFVLPPPF